MSYALTLSPGERLKLLRDDTERGGEALSTPLQACPDCEVTVAIVSSGRRQLYPAVESVCRQDFAHIIRILIIGDNCPNLPTDFPTPPQVKLIICNFKYARGYPERNSYYRVTHLRKLATSLVTTRFFCFLDDDNIWEVNHLSTLMHLIKETQLLAVHSWRLLVDRDNNPFIPCRYPWMPPGPLADSLFSIYCEHGVMDPQSAVIRDRPDLRVGGHEYGMIDMGEWLFEHALFSLIQFDEQESGDKHQLHCGEDDKLLHDMRKLAIPVACTEKPTLRYRLGGMSNDYND